MLEYADSKTKSVKNTAYRLTQFDPRAALRNTEIFNGLGDDAFEAIAGLIHWRTYNKGAEVVSYRGKGRDVYFIADGRVRATIFSLSGKEISFQELEPGSMFGELSAITGEPRTTNVIVLETAHIGSLSSGDFWKVLHEYQEFNDNVLNRVAGLVRYLCDRVYLFGAMDVTDRVRVEVLRLARANMSGENSAVVENMPTHMEIANRTNTHREAVSREFSVLNKLGLITQEKRVLRVHDVRALAKLLPEEI